jgi:methylated-DNA-[protein]-cysteine S-methyltransferase
MTIEFALTLQFFIIARIAEKNIADFILFASFSLQFHYLSPRSITSNLSTMLYTNHIATPVGPLEITADDEAVLEILFLEAKHKPSPKRPVTEASNAVLEKCKEELKAYFEGDLQIFTFKYRLEGTEFQVKTWQALEQIPYGTLISYGTQAKQIGNPKAARAVGLCNGNNPISIVVPCHRVVGANGNLTGYGGDLWVKEWLIKHELKQIGKAQPEQLSLF